MKEIGEILGLVLIIPGIFVLTWLTTKFLSKRLHGSGKTGNLRVIERLPLGRDRQVVLVKAGDEHVLVGLSGQHISFSQALRLDRHESSGKGPDAEGKEVVHENEAS